MIYFVGAGPGAADLITVRGARLLREADVVVYAGSLVNPELLGLCKPDCAIYDSSRMTLEQIVDVLVAADAAGKLCVRLHTGDPALYGAHGEQMEELDLRGIAYEVVPGVSSLFGATAALRTELTVPEVSQTVIVTRMEGRTPMPEGERLRDLSTHGCTMALFLSAGLIEGVQRELLQGGYDPSTPTAIVVRATWPDEAVYRCTVATLVECAREHNVTKTALVLVGAFLDACGARSQLYDANFSHGYRSEGGPKGSIPIGSGPKGSTPIGSGPKGSIPIGPKGSTPIGSGPKGSIPIGSGPKGSTPIGSGKAHRHLSGYPQGNDATC